MIQSPEHLTLEQFLDCRFDLPEAGQWAELQAGQIVLLQPPDLDHGNTLLNFSKAMADWAHQAGARESAAYACFDLGLRIEREPDTVRFPAVSIFHEGPRFAESDRAATDSRPAIVLELLTSAERRAQFAARATQYLSSGVRAVWGVDPRARSGHDIRTAQSAETDSRLEFLEFPEVLPGFRLDVASLFHEPEWWSRAR
ncbi:MAG: Uma2 family endonuclease [Planctomycetaceae bacterium]